MRDSTRILDTVISNGERRLVRKVESDRVVYISGVIGFRYICDLEKSCNHFEWRAWAKSGRIEANEE
jgi:hypothetical protein